MPGHAESIEHTSGLLGLSAFSGFMLLQRDKLK